MSQPEDSEALAKLLVSNFIERQDVKAIQTASGDYMPVRENPKDTSSPTLKFGLRDIIAHVEGKTTYGHYLVSKEGTCRVIVFDIDLRAKANPARDERPYTFEGVEYDPREVWAGPDSPCKRNLAMMLRVTAESIGRRATELTPFKTMVSYSGCKGMHVYVCLPKGTPAETARDAAGAIIDSYDGLLVADRGNNFFKHAERMRPISIEVFPKQDVVNPNGGFGNLIRLPLGINQKSGKRGFFLDMATPQHKFQIDDPALALQLGSFRE